MLAAACIMFRLDEVFEMFALFQRCPCVQHGSGTRREPFSNLALNVRDRQPDDGATGNRAASNSEVRSMTFLPWIFSPPLQSEIIEALQKVWPASRSTMTSLGEEAPVQPLNILIVGKHLRQTNVMIMVK